MRVFVVCCLLFVVYGGLQAGGKQFVGANKLVVCDSLEVSHQQYEDSILDRLFIAEYKITKIKEYIRICKAKPTQRRFFFGWVDRTLNK